MPMEVTFGPGPDPHLYITLDVETSGPRPGTDSLLSLGACVVTAHGITPVNQQFYAEFKPTSLEYYHEAMKWGASELDALKPVVHIPKLCPINPYFEPKPTLVHLQDSERCQYLPTAMRQFKKWLDGVGRYKQVMPVVDTTFFDSGWFNYVCAEYGYAFPWFGHSGLDLRSYWAGRKQDPWAKLSSIPVKVENLRKHHALHDANELAELARAVLYDKVAP